MRFFCLVTVMLLILTSSSIADTSADDIYGLKSPVLPHRIFDMRTGTVIDFEGLLHRLASADVVTLGEYHGDAATHIMELAILQGMDRVSDGRVELSMEMFERDVQDVIDQYLNGEIDEEEFLANGRPSQHYEKRYRPMVEYCRESGLRMLGANLPWSMAIQVAMEGLDKALESFAGQSCWWLPEDFEAPLGAYQQKHLKTMKGLDVHGSGELSEEQIAKYYQSQVLKDEAMAESIYLSKREHPDFTMYHIVGAFHTEDFMGTYERIVKRMPDADLVSILVRPVEDLMATSIEGIPGCHYVIFVLGEDPRLRSSHVLPLTFEYPGD